MRRFARAASRAGPSPLAPRRAPAHAVDLSLAETARFLGELVRADKIEFTDSVYSSKP